MKHIISILSFLLLVVHGNGQEFNFINYGVGEGLPQSQVFDIIQDSKGYLWLATEGGGVSRFDGVTFETFSTKDKLSSNYVSALYEGSDGKIWIGTRSGFCRYSGNKIDFTLKNELEVLDIIEVRDSLLWLATQSGIYTFHKSDETLDKVKLHPVLDGVRVNAFLKRDREIWVGTSRGLFKVEEDEVSHVTMRDGLLSDDIQDLAAANGLIWLAQFGGGLSAIDEQTLDLQETYNTNDIRLAQEVAMIGDEVWVGTQDKGLHIFGLSVRQRTKIRERDGLSHDNIKALLRDQWGNIWIGTSGGGLSKYIGKSFAHYTKNNGLNGNRIYAIHEARDGRLWMSVDNKGVTILDGDHIRHDVDSSHITVKVNHIHEDAEGTMWISTAGQGLVRRDSTGWRTFTKADGMPSDWIQSTVSDREGHLWVASYADGIARMTIIDTAGLGYELYNKQSGLPDLLITSMLMNDQGQIWFATKKGEVGYFDGARATLLARSDGLANVSIRSIAFDSFDNVWVGTAGDGIYRASMNDDVPTLRSIAINEGLTSSNIYLLVFDGDGHLWAGSEVGVDKLIINNSGDIIDMTHFGRNEGFLGIETCHNAAVLDSEGHLWFGTLNGLMRHTPVMAQTLTSRPAIHISTINLSYRPIEDTEFATMVGSANSFVHKASFPYDQNDFSFDFKGINLDHPDDIRYSWRLVGDSEEWSPWSPGTSVSYANLSTGFYRFEVKARSNRRDESDTITTSFYIAPALWQQWWFRLLMICGAGIGVYALYALRIRKMQDVESKKRAALLIENEILGLEQKALQLQMNPHFIFNALNSIQSLVVNKKMDTAREQIQNFALLMRGVLNNSKQERISLKEEVETLHQYLIMEQFCQANRFDFTINTPTEYDAEEIELPPMMIQPFVENAVIHGVSHLNGDGHISVDFETRGQLLICTISDNGVGRRRAGEMSVKSNKGHQSTAINITKKRLEVLKKGRSYKCFSIEDILGTNDTVKGTKVVLTMPLETSF